MNRLLAKLRALFRKEKLDRDMAEEMRFHLAQRAADHVEDGLSPDEARYAAQRKFGGVEQIKEQCRDERGGRWLEDFSQDRRYAFRQLRGNPGFALVAILTLAIGIGANTTFFSIGNALLFRGLSAERPAELVTLFFGDAERNGTDNHSYADYLDYRRESGDVLSGLAAFTPEQSNLIAGAETERVCAGFVTENYFSVLGVPPMLGRGFRPQENLPGAEPVAMISEALWRRHFGATAEALGRTLGLNNQAYTIIGVVPDSAARLLAVLRVDVFVPVAMRRDSLTQRGNKEFMVIGRLREGVSLVQAQARFEVLAHQLAEAHPAEWKSRDRARPLTVVPAGSVPFGLRGYASLFFGALLALTTFVLLIVCANLAGLLLARGTARRREIAVRLALGANRRRIVRQLLTESLMLAALGGALSLPPAYVCLRILTNFAPNLGTPLLIDVGLDARELGFNLGVSLVAAIIFGLAPALHATRERVSDSLKAGELTAGHSPRRFSLRNLLVISQVATSLILLLGAGMFLRSIGKLSSVKLGFARENLALLSVDLALHGYSPERAGVYYADTLERLAAVPGVQAVDVARRVPIGFNKVGQTFVPEGGKVPNEEALFGFNIVGPRYFETLQIPVLLGRAFGSQDAAGSPRVAIINETMARLCWPGENALGKQLQTENGATLEVVGVCRTSAYHSLRERPQPFVYLPWTQHPSLALTFHVKTSGDATAMLGLLREHVRATDGGVTVFDVKTMSDHLAVAMLPVQLGANLLGAFSILALALASLGLYGVMAYTVRQRTREIGIRMALGGTRRRVLGTILRTGMKLALAGIACGFVVGAGLSAVIASQFYGMTAADGALLLLLGIGVLAVALLACWLPARRATEVDPMVALRCE
jgi:macrolide transport system ATP-binding/permease protein